MKCKLSGKEYESLHLNHVYFSNRRSKRQAEQEAFRMSPRLASQRMACRHSWTSLSRMGRLRLYMFIARGLCARPVFRFLERGFLRIRRIWITRWTLLLYSLKSQSGLLPESTTHPMYLLLLMTSSYLLQEKPESPHFSNSLCHCALR